MSFYTHTIYNINRKKQFMWGFMFFILKLKNIYGYYAASLSVHAGRRSRSAVSGDARRYSAASVDKRARRRPPTLWPVGSRSERIKSDVDNREMMSPSLSRASPTIISFSREPAVSARVVYYVRRASTMTTTRTRSPSL